MIHTHINILTKGKKMELKHILKWLIIATSIMLFTACSNRTSSNGNGGDNVDSGTVTIIPPVAPTYPASSNLTINLKDASNNSGLAGALVKITGNIINSTSDTATTDASGKVTFNLDQSQFTDVNKDGIADEAKEVTVLISSDSILNRSITFLLTNYGENFKDIQIINLNANDAPEGVVIFSKDVNLNTVADTVINGIPVKIVEATTTAFANTAVPTVAIPLTTTFLSDKGVELDGNTLSVEIIAFDPNSENATDLLSNGMSYQIGNPSLLAADLGIATEDAQNVGIAFMGVVSINISDANGNKAMAVIGNDPVALTIPIATNMLNPATGNFVVAGDTIALLSLSDDTNTWNYEGEHTVTTDNLGNLLVRYESTHFSTFGFGNVKSGQCTGTINIITQHKQPYSDIGSFRLQGSYINADSPYNGEGSLSYTNLTDEPLKIIFTPLDGSSVILSKDTTVNGTIETDNSIITNVSPCDAAGKTIIFEALIASVPKIYIDKTGHTSQSSRSIVEGTDGAFAVTLENPPVGQAISFSIRSKDDTIGNNLSITEQKYTFDAGVTSLTIPYSALENDLIEGTKSFEIEFYDADNRAVFVGGYNSTNSNYLTSISIIDNDRLIVKDINYTAIEENLKANITFTLDQVVPELFTSGVQIFIKAYADNTTDATEMIDFDSKTYVHSRYTSHGSYVLDFKKGTKSATVSIPLYDNLDVDSNETFLIDMRPSNIVNFDINTTQEITITDSDTLPDTNVTSYSIELIRFGYKDNRLDKNETWEGEVNWLKVTLDKATRHPLKIAYSAPNNPNYTLEGTGELTFEKNDATKYIAITTFDNGITNPEINFEITLDSNLTGPTSQAMTIKDDDYDYMYISNWNSSEASVFEGYRIQPEFYVYSNYSTLNIDYLTEGNNNSVAGILTYAAGTYPVLIGDPLLDPNDDIVNPPRVYTSTSTLSIDPLETGSSNFAVYIYGSTSSRCGNLWNPTIAEYNLCNTFIQTINVLDDDTYLFAIETPPSVEIDVQEGSTTIAPGIVPLKLSAEKLNRAVSFDLQGGKTLTLTEAEPSKDFAIVIPSIEIEPNLKVGDKVSKQFAVSITMTEESEKALQEANLDYKLNTSVDINITYTIIKADGPIIPTGSEGGS